MASLSIKSIKSVAPLFDRILVQRVKPVEQTKSGLYLPSSAKSTPPEAKVLAVGPGAFAPSGERIPVSVKPGDKVLLPAVGGVPVKVEEEEYHLFRDHDILATLQE